MSFLLNQCLERVKNMKLIFLALVALCVYAQGAVLQDDKAGESYEARTGPIKHSLKQSSALAEDLKADSQLVEALTAVERALDRNFLGNMIINVLENLRPVIVNGNDAIPPLDPLHIPQIGPFLYTTLGTRITGHIHDFRFEGLSWYIIDYVNVNAFQRTLSVKVTVPWLTFTGYYDAAAFIGFVSHRAGGHYRIFVNRLEVSTDARIGVSIFGGRLFLQELVIDIAIHDVTLRIDGVTGSNTLNGLINAALQATVQNLLHNELEVVSNRLSEQLFDVINEFLGNFTLEDLLG